MNKEKFIERLVEKTGRTNDECVLINDIIDKHFIIGKNNKEKIKNDFMSQLNISESEADELYNVCSEIIVKGVFKRK